MRRPESPSGPSAGCRYGHIGLGPAINVDAAASGPRGVRQANATGHCRGTRPPTKQAPCNRHEGVAEVAAALTAEVQLPDDRIGASAACSGRSWHAMTCWAVRLDAKFRARYADLSTQYQ